LQNIINKNARFNSLLNVETFFCLFILFLIAAKELYGFQHYLDISFFDESEYIRKGVQLRQHIFNDWGPSYNLWYFFLFQLTKDATTVFLSKLCHIDNKRSMYFIFTSGSFQNSKKFSIANVPFFTNAPNTIK